MVLFITLTILMVFAGLYFVLPPLLGRYKVSETLHNELNLAIYQQRLAELEDDNETELSTEQKAQARKELEKSLLQDLSTDETPDIENERKKSPTLAVSIVFSIPLIALGLYGMVGPAELPEILAGTPVSSANANAGDAHSGNNLPDINKMVANLESRLQQNPNDAEGWQMLARSYMFTQRFGEAVNAYDKALQLGAEEPQLLADYAEAIAMGQGGAMQGRPEELVLKALQLEPMHPKSLWLAGAAKLQIGQPQGAIDYWERLMTMHEPGSEGAGELQKRIDIAKQALTESGQTATNNAQKEAPKTVITVSVDLDPKLKTKANADDTLFVFARAVNGPPMPLAIVRKQVKDLPLNITLDDNMAMMPGARMSNFEKIYVGARISKSGTAMPETGDLQGRSSILNSGGNHKVNVTIEQEIL